MHLLASGLNFINLIGIIRCYVIYYITAVTHTTQSVQHRQRKKLGTNFLPISIFHTFYHFSILLMGLSQSVICVDNAVCTISRQIYHNRSNLQIFEQGRVGVIVAPCIGVIVAHRPVYYYQFWSIPVGRIISVFGSRCIAYCQPYIPNPPAHPRPRPPPPMTTPTPVLSRWRS